MIGRPLSKPANAVNCKVCDNMRPFTIESAHIVHLTLDGSRVSVNQR
jgi:hypothetical protein